VSSHTSRKRLCNGDKGINKGIACTRNRCGRRDSCFLVEGLRYQPLLRRWGNKKQKTPKNPTAKKGTAEKNVRTSSGRGTGSGKKLRFTPKGGARREALRRGKHREARTILGEPHEQAVRGLEAIMSREKLVGAKVLRRVSTDVLKGREGCITKRRVLQGED